MKISTASFDFLHVQTQAQIMPHIAKPDESPYSKGMVWLVSDRELYLTSEVEMEHTEYARTYHHPVTAYCLWENYTLQRLLSRNITGIPSIAIRIGATTLAMAINNWLCTIRNKAISTRKSRETWQRSTWSLLELQEEVQCKYI